MPEEPEVELVFHESLTSLVTPAFCRTVLQALATPPPTYGSTSRM